MTEESPINPHYIPVVYQFKDTKKDILTTDSDIITSPHVSYPKLYLGFQHYIHQSKLNMEITKDFKGRKKIYYVMSKFERYVDDYDKDVNHLTTKYFGLDSKARPPKILSRAFYKLWELLFMFELVDHNAKDFVSAHLAEGPGSFIQATMFYRDKFASRYSKNDKYYGVTLHAEDIKKYVPKMEEEFVKFYGKEKPLRFNLHKTHPIKDSKGSKLKDNGDLTTKKTRDLFGGNFSQKKANFVTADGGFDWKNENLQEQEAYKLILSQIVTALKIQASKGNFICKIYESFTEITAKFILILKSFYEQVFVCKPLMSRASNSEKYIVCLRFKDDKGNAKKISSIETILEKMTTSNSAQALDMFTDYQFEPEFYSTLIGLNTKLSNRQFEEINNIISFVKRQNFRGEEYTQKRGEQIKATEYWASLYLPSTSDFSKRKEMIEKMTKSQINQ